MTAAPSPSRLTDVAGGLAVAALLLAVHSKSMMVDVDVFHEMALYRAALRDGAVPTEDQFAYTPTVSPCVHHEWGTGLVLYHATASFGAAGLVALRYALTVALCLLLLTVLRRQGVGGPLLVLTALLAVPLGSCLVPADGFYEWLREGKRKQPFCFRLHDDRPFAFAAIWDAWREPGGTLLLTCAVLTTEANELVRPVHDRMPVIVPERDYDLWIDRNMQDVAELAPVLRPLPAEEMRAFAVGPTVNDPRNDGPGCLAPAG